MLVLAKGEGRREAWAPGRAELPWPMQPELGSAGNGGGIRVEGCPDLQESAQVGLSWSLMAVCKVLGFFSNSIKHKLL